MTHTLGARYGARLNNRSDMPICVFQDWLFALPMQQQSVLILACRGPDGVGKVHQCKPLVARYRATILKSAKMGRPLDIGEDEVDVGFMALRGFTDDAAWSGLLGEFFKSVDELPHHYYMHLMHGAEIAGYKHSHPLFRRRWYDFYCRCCDDLHVTPEIESEMDRRLCDWDQKRWEGQPGAHTDPARTEPARGAITDAERLDFLEAHARSSNTGVSVDRVPTVEGEPGGYRFMRRSYIGTPRGTLRAALDAEILRDRASAVPRG